MTTRLSLCFAVPCRPVPLPSVAQTVTLPADLYLTTMSPCYCCSWPGKVSASGLVENAVRWLVKQPTRPLRWLN